MTSAPWLFKAGKFDINKESRLCIARPLTLGLRTGNISSQCAHSKFSILQEMASDTGSLSASRSAYNNDRLVGCSGHVKSNMWLE